MNRTILVISIGLISTNWSCRKIESLPEIPRVEYKSFALSESTDTLGNQVVKGELTFYFEDGDGDIGWKERQVDSLMQSSDSLNSNLFLSLYEKVDSQYMEVELNEPLYYIIPYIEREGQNKTLKGEVKVDLYYYLIEYDTIRYDFFIVDRARHKSNVDSTGDIGLTEYRN